jgi:hypothetical protein
MTPDCLSGEFQTEIIRRSSPEYATYMPQSAV